MASVLPAPEEHLSLAPRPGGPVWRAASDVRVLSTAGYALLLQVAHPTVGAGVGEHSDFRADPWGRLLRTLDYVNLLVYGSPEQAAETARRVREMHKRIKGTRPDGRRYHALEPEAYAWVHATLASALADGARTFGTPLKPGEHEDFWTEWVRVGRLVGVRPGELPERWAGFADYFDAMVRDELEDTPTVHLVLEALTQGGHQVRGGNHHRWCRHRLSVSKRTGRLRVRRRMAPSLRPSTKPGQRAHDGRARRRPVRSGAVLRHQ